MNPTRKRRRSSENRPLETPKAIRHKKRRGAGRGKRRSAVRNLGPARNPVIWSQLAALLTDFAVLYGLMPQGIDQAQTQELVAVALAMVGSHAGFGVAARQSVRPLAKEREEG